MNTNHRPCLPVRLCSVVVGIDNYIDVFVINACLNCLNKGKMLPTAVVYETPHPIPSGKRPPPRTDTSHPTGITKEQKEPSDKINMLLEEEQPPR